MGGPRRMSSALLLPFALLSLPRADTTNATIYREELESSLRLVHAVATGATGALCVTQRYGRLLAPLHAARWDSARARADLAANLLHQLGLETAEILMAVSQGLVLGASPAERAVGARALALRSDGVVNSAVAWERYGTADPVAVVSPQLEKPPDPEYPWYVSAHNSDTLRSSKFMPSPPGATMEGWWTYPYYSCEAKRWLLSYTVPVATIRGLKGVVSLDIDISNLEINQCEDAEDGNDNQIYSFHGTHKCPNETTYCEYKPNREVGVRHSGWARGMYNCRCRPGYYSTNHPEGFNGSLVEVAYQEYEKNRLENWNEPYECLKCQPGCETCRGPEPCLATYNWPFRISLLVISVSCAVMTVCLTIYTRHHRRVKVFRVASPVFLSITLLGCAIMYMEMAAIFPVLDRYSCIATKWTRHMGFCITYTALLMKTWRVSLTYRVKSAHKLKLTDKQLLQWMAPILLIMLVYLGTWTLSSPPDAEVITDNRGLKFKQCTYNWWDHSLAIGEILFLLWGVRVCYRVRHAESLYNEARLISIAIYNIFTVNSLMIAFHLLILPRAGPDIKYLLGFIRTQLSTSTTVLLVFLPKVVRVARGTGDTWDSRSRARGLPAASSLNGVGLVPDEPPDLYQENEELKEEVQKLAAQIEFMKIVQMEMHNRHLRPRPGGYFTANTTGAGAPQSPMHQKTVSIAQDNTEWAGPV
ncbi:probable G-protein coupled receptor CG31760 [Galleria mellonella]|uniref:Probable G-protein coupled receptor CG31760 n=1 Tax=Galleria mellonella TaxID=7137 RepID=A0A6J1WU43_GALME|nr:probable G-protein coupled receptor CG31760 [Galleria mellonella]XP_031764625.2 probable G-protein coupled receptor CG31760 [Galleria mellonella]